MTEEGDTTPPKPVSRAKAKATQPNSTSWLSLPKPIRRVFERFPLTTCAENALPQRAPRRSPEHVLYLFQHIPGSKSSAPSCNPSCLKWQAYLRFRNVPFKTQAANNHASPSGALPFLLPSRDSIDRPSSPIAANRITRWVAAQGGSEEPLRIREEAYSSLIDHNIRNAWLHYLYLDKDNFESVARPMYVATASRSILVRVSIASQLQSAARLELLKSQAAIDSQELYESAEKAFESLATLLGKNDYFFGLEEPGLFDASLFAYTQILLDENLNWQNTVLTESLMKHENLVQHRRRLVKQYFES